MWRRRGQPLFIILFVLISDLRHIYSQDFTYDGPLGPLHWGEQYNGCYGKYQSPINIDPKLVSKVSLPPIVFNGFETLPASAKVTNNGHTVMLTMDFNQKPTVTGGPLDGEYEFVQLHFHWGDHDGYGSESLINYRSYPVELHMVLYKAKYDSFKNALDYADGITVLASLFEVSPTANPNFDEITMLINDIVAPDTERQFINPPNLAEFLSKDNVHYYTYNGSLTTPPCSESVTWIDFSVPIPISSSQIASFRRIRDHHGLLLKHNSRPIQPLNGRTVLYNMEPIDFESDKNKYDLNDIRYDIVSEPTDPLDSKYEKHTNADNSSRTTHDSNKLLTPLLVLIFFVIQRI